LSCGSLELELLLLASKLVLLELELPPAPLLELVPLVPLLELLGSTLDELSTKLEELES
jgi:hypothetical protein